jgi:hypothetical protein
MFSHNNNYCAEIPLNKIGHISEKILLMKYNPGGKTTFAIKYLAGKALIR